jgi:hypothetical protein
VLVVRRASQRAANVAKFFGSFFQRRTLALLVICIDDSRLFYGTVIA